MAKLEKAEPYTCLEKAHFTFTNAHSLITKPMSKEELSTLQASQVFWSMKERYSYQIMLFKKEMTFIQ